MTVWRPQLVALDVDGTVVNGRNQLTPAVREAVQKVQADGVPVVIATGRAIPGVTDVADRLGLVDGLAVASNGSVVMGYRPVDLLHTETFDASVPVRRILEQIPDALVAVEDVGRGYRLNRHFPETEITGTMTIQTVDELIAEPVTRVVIRSPEHDSDDFHRLVADLGLHEINYYVGYTAWLDLAPSGVSKASGLEQVCARLGVHPDDVLAVGDGHNDAEMLRWAGRGVAMGHAPASLRELADEVTDDIDADGLVPVLRRWW